MIIRVGRVGSPPEKLVYRNFRIERQGFLTVFTYERNGYEHDGRPRRMDGLHRGHAVVVMPVDFAKREVYMLSEIRPLMPFGGTPEGRAWMEKVKRDAFTTPAETFEIDAEAAREFAFPAGMIDGNEAPLDAAVRELREETGLIVPPESFRPIASLFPSIGGSTEMVHLFLADLPDPTAIEAPRGDGIEELDVYRMSFEDAFGLLKEGRVVATSSSLLLRELKIIELEQALRVLHFLDHLIPSRS